MITEEYLISILEGPTYNEFFKSKLAKYGVSSPDKLSPEQKKKFFNEIEWSWTKEKSGKD